MPFRFKMALIGAGNMAEAIARGVCSAGLLRAEQLAATDPSEVRRSLFAQQLGISAVGIDNVAVATDAELILLAVKPQQMRPVVAEIAPHVGSEQLVVSIMAGVSTAVLEGMLAPTRARVVRVMPNLPMAVGAGMAGIAAGRHARPEDLRTAEAIFRCAGEAIIVPERLLDAVTALSGSGPAYFYFWTEAMIEAGEQLGLTREQAAQLSKQTALGAARMMLTTGEEPAELRRRVTSPGGTTLAAITSMHLGRIREEIIKAIHAAAARSAELGQ